MSESHAVSGDEEINWFWEEMEGDVLATLTADQRIAIENAVRKSAAHTQPADMRIYLGKYFIRIIAGKERRNKARQKQDLKNNPFFASKNIPVLIIFSIFWIPSVLYIVAFLKSVLKNLIS